LRPHDLTPTADERRHGRRVGEAHPRRGEAPL